MLFSRVDSIRDTISFPKTASALSLMDESPSVVSKEQLKELHIKLRDWVIFPDINSFSRSLELNLLWFSNVSL